MIGHSQQSSNYVRAAMMSAQLFKKKFFRKRRAFPFDDESDHHDLLPVIVGDRRPALQTQQGGRDRQRNTLLKFLLYKLIISNNTEYKYIHCLKNYKISNIQSI